MLCPVRNGNVGETFLGSQSLIFTSIWFVVRFGDAKYCARILFVPRLAMRAAMSQLSLETYVRICAHLV